MDRKVLAAAFLQAQALLTTQEPVSAEEAQRIEATLRPLAAAPEIRQVMVPLLDRAQLYGLAMAWDSGPEEKPAAWLYARADRFIRLTVPEFAFLTLCELKRLNASLDDTKQRAAAALDQERAIRAPMLEQNLAVLSRVDPEGAEEVRRAHRVTSAMRPVGAGLAEFAGPGQPWVQLWAVTSAAARLEADRLVLQCCAFEDAFIAGVGDCSLPAAAALVARENKRVHVIDLHVSRIRALLEIVDLRGPVGDRRMLLHGGTRALQTLAPYAKRALLEENSVVGGDPVAVSLLKAAAQGG